MKIIVKNSTMVFASKKQSYRKEYTSFEPDDVEIIGRNYYIPADGHYAMGNGESSVFIKIPSFEGKLKVEISTDAEVSSIVFGAFNDVPPVTPSQSDFATRYFADGYTPGIATNGEVYTFLAGKNVNWIMASIKGYDGVKRSPSKIVVEEVE